MALIVGLLLIILGTVALCVWSAQVLVFLQGLVVFSLLFWGLLSLIVGYAGWKSKKQRQLAIAGDGAPSDENPATPQSDKIPPPTA